MANPGIPKLSLLAQFDDLCRYSTVLTVGSEGEFKTFVENQLIAIRKWKNAESDVENLTKKISSLENEKKRLEIQIKHLRNLFEAEVNKRKTVESEKRSMERQIALIKEVLLADGVMDNQTREKLGFLNSTSKPSYCSPTRLGTIDESVSSLLSLCDVTEDDLEDTRRSSRRKSKGRRSSSESRLPSKKKKSDPQGSEEYDSETDNINTPYKAHEVRSNSEPTSNTQDTPYNYQVPKIDADPFKSSTYDSRRYSAGIIAGGCTPGGGQGKLSRKHSFVQKIVIRTEKCYPCGKIVKFCKQALKCQECRVICHPECKDQCPLPCIPTVNTPTKGVPGSIADYVSSFSPMVPPLIVHCVEEIESRGLKDIGLYRISGSEREVKDLKEKFLRGRNRPYLKNMDVHALCGTIKEFLRSLKEPLVTRNAWQAFVDAAEIKDTTLSLNAVFETVTDLPQPNRDTLAFLVLHLQKVAESPHCRMPISNLAKVFGPTIVGYSLPDPIDTQMFSETNSQCKVMERLLSVPSDSWHNVIVEPEVFTKNTMKTPENLQVPQSSRLGPLSTPLPQRVKIQNFGKRTPGRYLKDDDRKKMFSSPRIE